ncbi:MAG: DinB family protein [Bacteroidota bacterium]|nr:hypothetical protein [Candidatus Kapabacteria bacterium]MDW8219061.1 DinB family protein [Bacteroidota bacterium]
MTIAHFLDQLDYTLWANKRTLASIESLPSTASEADRAQAIKLMSHIVAAQYIWYARVCAQPSAALPVWESMTPEALHQRIPEAYTLWKEYLSSKQDSDLSTLSFTYTNTLGNEYTNTLLEILTHFPIHSAYHRAQIAMLVRANGGTPAVTDYIQFAREEHKR